MFTERAKTIALAIVHIFETGKALGDYGAVAVLSDGAGFSVGINQFTHKSGSLAAVIDRFFKLGGEISEEMSVALPDFRKGRNISKWSSNQAIKGELQALGRTDLLWQQAQREIAFENYLSPALQACEGSGFKHPLSLAVVYDSFNQGGYATVRDRVSADPENEKAWIAEFCGDRVAWLKNSRKAIVRGTVYRPNFFLSLIAHGNWNLDLPLSPNGHKLTESILFPAKASAVADPTSGQTPIGSSPSASGGESGQSGASPQPQLPGSSETPIPELTPEPTSAVPVQTVEADHAPGGLFETIESKYTTYSARYPSLIAAVMAGGAGIWAYIQNAPSNLITTLAIVSGGILAVYIIGRLIKEIIGIITKHRAEQQEKDRLLKIQLAIIEAGSSKEKNAVVLMPPPARIAAEGQVTAGSEQGEVSES